MAGSAKHRPCMEKSWGYLGDNDDPRFIWGKGYQFILMHANRTSYHPLAVGATLLATLAALANWAFINVFPSGPTPLIVLALLVNFTHARKSQMMKVSKTLGDNVDVFIMAELIDLAKKDLAEQNNAGVVDGVSQGAATSEPNVKAVSAVLSSFTPEEFFERCSGGSAQLENAYEVGVRRKLRGSVYVGRLANVDEVYASIQSFGLVNDDSKRSSAATAVNQHAGALNRLLQWGDSSRATKSS